MCIIAAKPSGIPMPKEDTLRNMWEANPDGAGFMYPSAVTGKNGKEKPVVQIEKGFMTWEAFKAALDKFASTHDMTATPIVMHFRITTHGGTCPELTHPFPVTKSHGVLRKLRSTTPVGIAHNGIIHSVTAGKDMSDTSEYVASQLAPLHAALPRFWESPHALELIRNAIGSKMAILSADGKITTVGDFIEDGGILYSNSSYSYRRFSFSYSSCGGWDSHDWDYGSHVWDECVPKKLMPMSEATGSYLTLEDGSMLDTDFIDTYAIDHSRTVYQYDEYIDVWVRLDGATPYSKNGSLLPYVGKNATWEDTMSLEAACELYDEIEFGGYEDEDRPDLSDLDTDCPFPT